MRREGRWRWSWRVRRWMRRGVRRWMRRRVGRSVRRRIRGLVRRRCSRWGSRRGYSDTVFVFEVVWIATPFAGILRVLHFNFVICALQVFISVVLQHMPMGDFDAGDEVDQRHDEGELEKEFYQLHGGVWRGISRVLEGFLCGV